MATAAAVAAAPQRIVSNNARLAHEAVTGLIVTDPQDVLHALRKLRQTLDAAPKATFADLFIKRGGMEQLARILASFVTIPNLRDIVEEALVCLHGFLSATRRAARAAINAECDTRFMFVTLKSCAKHPAIVQLCCMNLRILVDHDVSLQSSVKACQGVDILVQVALRHLRRTRTSGVVLETLQRVCKSTYALESFSRASGVSELLSSFPKALDARVVTEPLLTICANASNRGAKTCASLVRAGVVNFAIDRLMESSDFENNASNALTILHRIDLSSAAYASLSSRAFDKLYPLLGLYLGRDTLLQRLCIILWKLHSSSQQWDMSQLMPISLEAEQLKQTVSRWMAATHSTDTQLPTTEAYRSYLFDHGKLDTHHAILQASSSKPSLDCVLALADALHIITKTRGTSSTSRDVSVLYDWQETRPTQQDDLSGLSFCCDFESGNLARVEALSSSWYSFWLRADSNSYGQLQWFYFSMRGLRPGTTLNFIFNNLEKTDSMFNLGMRPLLFSPQAADRHGAGWRRTGSKVSYFENPFTKPTCTTNNSDQGSTSKTMPCYTFHVEFTVPDIFRESDTIYMAYCFPYTYSNLLTDLEDISRRTCVEQSSLCQTLGGLDCPLLTITDPEVDTSSIPDKSPENEVIDDLEKPDQQEVSSFQDYQCSSIPLNERQYIFLSARVHPGETNSSFMMRGALNFLSSNDPQAKALRSRYIFKIVPMLNPDGVVAGNHRCNLAGLDLNRQWCAPRESTAPTIYHLQKMMKSCASPQKIALYLDMHGHSRKAGIFLYGCEDKKTFGAPERIYPYLVDATASNEHFFLQNCNFKVQKSKANCARVVVWRDFRVVNSFTLEASMSGNNERHFVVSDLETMGRDSMAALWHLIDPEQSEVQRVNACLRLEFPKNFLTEPETIEDDDEEVRAQTEKPCRPRTARPRITKATKSGARKLGRKRPSRRPSVLKS